MQFNESGDSLIYFHFYLNSFLLIPFEMDGIWKYARANIFRQKQQQHNIQIQLYVHDIFQMNYINQNVILAMGWMRKILLILIFHEKQIEIS